MSSNFERFMVENNKKFGIEARGKKVLKYIRNIFGNLELCHNFACTYWSTCTINNAYEGKVQNPILDRSTRA